jgi:hypothetical protein
MNSSVRMSPAVSSRAFVRSLCRGVFDHRGEPITKENGPYIANGAMRILRAIYNHARKTNKKLPPDNPADAVDWNEEKRRDTGTGAGDLKGWFSELAALQSCAP